MTSDALARATDLPSPWMTLEQIEARWGVKATAVKAAIDSGRLPRSRMGTATLIHYDDFDAFLTAEKGTVKPAKEQKA